MKKIYSTVEGYSAKDFIHFGLDHCQSGIYLFATTMPRCYDSAAYLFHLGLEQILKAWHLEQFNQFENTHHLKKLLKKLRDSGIKIILSSQQEQLLSEIDSYSEIRYPRTVEGAIEIGDENLKEIVELVNYITRLELPLLNRTT